jgi:O-antigen/teichoic acid export membrane protein
MNSGDQFERFASTENVQNDLRAKSVRGAMFVGVASGVGLALRLVSGVVLARLLVPEHFGLVGMVIAVTAIAEQISSMGLSPATVQAPEISHKQCSNLFWINTAAGVVFCVLTCALAPVISAFYREPRLIAITLAMSTNFLWGGLTVQHEALLSRQMMIPQVTVNRLVANVLSTCLAVALALTGQGYWALVWREVSRYFLIAGGVWLLCRWLPGLPRITAGTGGLLRFGRNLTLAQLTIGTIARLDGVLIGKISGPISLGLYRQAENLVMQPIEQLGLPIRSVSQPGLSMLQNNPERYRRYYQRILLVISLASLPLGIFTTIYAREIVLVVLGPSWVGATVFLRIFGIAATFRLAAGTFGTVLLTCGRSETLLALSCIQSAVLAILMAVGVIWGAEGVAVARVSTTLLFIFPVLCYTLVETPITPRVFFGVVSRPFCASMMMAIILTLLRGVAPLDRGLVFLLVGLATATVTYFASFLLLPGGWVTIRSLFYDVLGERWRNPSATNADTAATKV